MRAGEEGWKKGRARERESERERERENGGGDAGGYHGGTIRDKETED